MIVSVVHHTLQQGELYRLGCITAVLPGSQSYQGGWFYGLRIAVHFVDLAGEVKIHVASTQAFDAWTKSRLEQTF